MLCEDTQSRVTIIGVGEVEWTDTLRRQRLHFVSRVSDQVRLPSTIVDAGMVPSVLILRPYGLPFAPLNASEGVLLGGLRKK